MNPYLGEAQNHWKMKKSCLLGGAIIRILGLFPIALSGFVTERRFRLLLACNGNCIGRSIGLCGAGHSIDHRGRHDGTWFSAVSHNLR